MSFMSSNRYDNNHNGSGAGASGGDRSGSSNGGGGSGGSKVLSRIQDFGLNRKLSQMFWFGSVLLDSLLILIDRSYF